VGGSLLAMGRYIQHISMSDLPIREQAPSHGFRVRTAIS
jgi:hypothetical protein